VLDRTKVVVARRRRLVPNTSPGQAQGRSPTTVNLGTSAAGRPAEAHASLQEAGASIAELARGGRLLEAALLSAMSSVARGRPEEAIAALNRLLAEAPPGFPGWTIPIEPLFEPLHAQPGFAGILARLAARAR